MRRWLALASFLAACGADPAPAPQRADRSTLDRCKANIGNIERRIAELEKEQADVEANRARLPPGYDQSSIETTLAQIASEIGVRRASLPGFRERCATLEADVRRQERADSPVRFEP